MRKWYVHALTGQIALHLMCLISVVSCLPPSGVDSAAFSDAASGADSPELTSEDVILREEVAEIHGNQIHFDKIREGYLKESGIRAILDIEFKSGAPFHLKKFGVAMNGGLGHYPDAFDLNRVSRWLPGTAAKLQTEVGKLAFESDRTFFAQALRVQNHRGRVILWLLSPACAIQKAKIIFVRERPSRVPAGLPSVVWDAVPPAQSDRRAVEFRFHSPEGTPLFFECAKDKQAFHRCESPKSFNSLNVGEHTFYARAVDSLKRRGPYAAYGFTIVKASNSVVIQRTEPTDSPTSSDTLKVWFSSASTLSAKQSLACQIDEGGFSACTSPFTFGSLAEGWHEIQIQIRDKKGKLTGQPTRYAWYVDKTGPELQFQEAPSPLTSDTRARFTWIVSEESTFRCQLDNGNEANCESPLELSGLGAGAHRLVLEARDEAGNPSQALEYAWTVENQAPRVTLDSVLPTEAVTSSRNFRVAFSADEPALFQCRVDEASEEACVSPFVVEGLGEGGHELEISAVDMSGNISEPISYRWVVDTTRPQVSIEWQSPGRSPTNQTSATFTFQSDDAARFYCDVNRGGASLCSSPWTVTGLAAGEQLLIVSAVDAAGNASEPASFAWVVDLIPPRLSLGRVEPVEKRTSSRALSLEFLTDEAGFTQCELDGAGASACVSPLSLSGLADGAHRIRVQIRDAAGNVSEPLVYEWEVESIPSVALQSASPAEPVTAAKQIAITFAANLPATFECRLDSEGFSACVSPWVREALGSGTHSFEVRALNDLGTAGPSVFYHWEVDADAPTLEWIGAEPAEPLTSSRAMAFRFSSENGAVFFCRLDAAAEIPCASPVVLGDLTDGAHDFVVVAADGLGNRSASYPYHWEVDATAPVLSPLARLPSAAVVKQREVTFSFTASEEVNFVCRIDSQSEAPCTSPYLVEGLADGSHEAFVRAKDNAGNESAVVSARFAVDATPPVVQLLYRTPAAALTSSRQVEIGFSASEVATFNCGIDGAAGSACTSPLILNALADGDHRIEIRAVDAAGNAGEPVVAAWQVDATGPTVSLISRVPASDLSSSNHLAVVFAASEPAQFRCSVDGTAPSPCASPFVLDGLADGNHVFQVSAVDSAGNEGAAISFGWAIDTVRPSITSLTREPSPPVVKQKTVNLQFGGSENGTFHCALDGAPAQPCSSPVTLSDLTEGGHQFAVRLTDATGNVSDALTASWTVDTIAPSIQGYSRNPAEDPSNSRSFLLHFSATELGSTFFCSMDGSAYAPCNDPMGVSALMDGSHHFRVYARDPAGNDGVPFSDSWLVDGTAPTMNLTGRNPAGPLVSSRSVAISFSANDMTASLFCSMDGQSFSPCASPFSAQGLGDGAHNFQVYARDAAGNQSASASDNWTVDTVAPSIVGLSRSPVGNLISVKTVTFLFNASEGSASFFCAVDGGASQSCGSPYALPNLTDGNHQFAVFARDAAGNEGAPVTDTFTVDTVAPVMAALSRSPAGNLLSAKSASITFSSNDAGASYFCALDGQAASACTSPYAATSLADGNHQFQVYARDAAGNQSAVQSDTFAVDATVPVVTLSLRAPSGNLVSSRSVTIYFSSDDSGATFQCTLDGQAATCASPFSATSLADGNHTFQVYARDAAGNQSAAVSDSWTVDATAPTVVLGARTPAGSLTSVKSVSIAFSANDAAASFTCALDGQAAACASPFTATNLTDGNHTFQVYGRDAAGNQSATISDSWTVDASAPTVTIGSRNPAGSLVSSKTISLTFSSADATATFFCALDGQASASCASPFSAASLADGNHSFQVYARDAAGNQSTVATENWSVDATAPIVSLGARTPAGSLVSAKSVSIPFGVNEAGALFFCSLDGQAAGPCASPYAASNLADGNHTFQVYARDVAGNQSATLSDSWTEDASAPTVAISSRTPAGSLVTAKSVSIAFSSSDAAAIFFCALDGQASASCASPFTSSNLSEGTHSFQVFARDAAGNQSSALFDSWTVDSVAPSAVIVSRSPAGALANSTSSSISFSSNDAGASFFCSLDGQAAASCASPFAVSGLGQGAHSFQVFARDAAGNQGVTASDAWSVDTVAPQIFWGAMTPSYSPSISQSKSIAFSASEAASLFCSVDGGSFVGCSSPYSASGLANGVHSLSVRAIDAAGNLGLAATQSWEVNTAALATSNVAITAITQSGAQVGWTTTLPANTRVVYGTGGNLNLSTVLDPANTVSHTVVLSGLAKFTLYSVQTVSVDQDGRETRSTTRTFRTSN